MPPRPGAGANASSGRQADIRSARDAGDEDCLSGALGAASSAGAVAARGLPDARLPSADSVSDRGGEGQHAHSVLYIRSFRHSCNSWGEISDNVT